MGVAFTNTVPEENAQQKAIIMEQMSKISSLSVIKSGYTSNTFENNGEKPKIQIWKNEADSYSDLLTGKIFKTKKKTSRDKAAK